MRCHRFHGTVSPPQSREDAGPGISLHPGSGLQSNYSLKAHKAQVEPPIDVRTFGRRVDL
jgi:hypothetical protein